MYEVLQLTRSGLAGLLGVCMTALRSTRSIAGIQEQPRCRPSQVRPQRLSPGFFMPALVRLMNRWCHCSDLSQDVLRAASTRCSRRKTSSRAFQGLHRGRCRCFRLNSPVIGEPHQPCHGPRSTPSVPCRLERKQRCPKKTDDVAKGRRSEAARQRRPAADNVSARRRSKSRPATKNIPYLELERVRRCLSTVPKLARSSARYRQCRPLDAPAS